jgi:hypothetical protein
MWKPTGQPGLWFIAGMASPSWKTRVSARPQRFSGLSVTAWLGGRPRRRDWSAIAFSADASLARISRTKCRLKLQSD